MIKPADGRGAHMTQRKKELREKIIAFFWGNPEGTIKQCATKLGVSQNTVSRHISEINLIKTKK